MSNRNVMGDLAAALPEDLPSGERVLWQGRPDWRVLARRGLHLRKLAVYFAVLLAWYAASTATAPGAEAGQTVLSVLRMAGLALVPLVLVCLYAWVTARGSLYLITDRRMVLRLGIAMPITFNLPYSRIESASAKLWADGHGDIALTLIAGEKMAYLVLWPHVRPWRLARAEPMLRCVADAGQVAQILGRALAASADMPVPAAPDGFSSTATRPHAAVLA